MHPEGKAAMRLKENIRDMLSLLKTVLCVAAAMFLLNGFVIANAIIPTSSMSPAIEPGDRVIGLRFLRNYRRGDIVVFDDPDVEGRYLIKRIIGIPGDHIAFLPGRTAPAACPSTGQSWKNRTWRSRCSWIRSLRACRLTFRKASISALATTGTIPMTPGTGTGN